MEFDWDEHNTAHIAQHGIASHDAEHVLLNNPLRVIRQIRNGEERITYAGPDTLGRILTVSATVRGSRTLVVTAFPASRKIRAWYRSLRGADLENNRHA